MITASVSSSGACSRTHAIHHHSVVIALRRREPVWFGWIRTRKGFQAPERRAARLRQILAGHKVDRVLAVPYFIDDFENAYLAKSLTGAPLCVYLMLNAEQREAALDGGVRWLARTIGVGVIPLKN